MDKKMSQSSYHILEDEFNEPEQARKIFVGNLPFERQSVATELLKSYFSRFGEIVDCVVPKDPGTRYAKGFAFVTFAMGTAVDEVMHNRPHKVAGRVLHPKRAFSRNETLDPAVTVSTAKLYIGSIGDLRESEIRRYFGRYGVIQELELFANKGEAFIVFQDHDSVDRIVADEHTVAGRPVETRKNLSISRIEKAIERRERQQHCRAQDRSHRQYYGGHHPYARPYNEENGGYHHWGRYDRGFDQGRYGDGGYTMERCGPSQEKYEDPYVREQLPPRGYDGYDGGYNRPPPDWYGHSRHYGTFQQNRYGGHPVHPGDSYLSRNFPSLFPPAPTPWHGEYATATGGPGFPGPMAYTNIQSVEPENTKLKREISSLRGQVDECTRVAINRQKIDANFIKNLKNQIQHVEEEQQDEKEKLKEAQETIKKSGMADKRNELNRSSEAKIRRLRPLKNHEIDMITTRFKRKAAELHLLRGELQELKMENDVLVGFNKTKESCARTNND